MRTNRTFENIHSERWWDEPGCGTAHLCVCYFIHFIGSRVFSWLVRACVRLRAPACACLRLDWTWVPVQGTRMNVGSRGWIRLKHAVLYEKIGNFDRRFGLYISGSSTVKTKQAKQCHVVAIGKKSICSKKRVVKNGFVRSKKARYSILNQVGGL